MDALINTDNYEISLHIITIYCH